MASLSPSELISSDQCSITRISLLSNGLSPDWCQTIKSDCHQISTSPSNLNKCQRIVNWTSWNNFNATWKTKIHVFSFLENDSENVVCKMTAILSFNSLWPNDVTWWHRSGSTWAQVMACCLMALSHYLNQCWPFICEVQWQSLEIPLPPITEMSLKITYLKFRWNPPGASELIHGSRGSTVSFFTLGLFGHRVCCHHLGLSVCLSVMICCVLF